MSHGYNVERQVVKPVFITFRLEKEMRDKLHKISQKLGCKHTDFIRHAVKKELAEAASKLFK